MQNFPTRHDPRDIALAAVVGIMIAVLVYVAATAWAGSGRRPQHSLEVSEVSEVAERVLVEYEVVPQEAAAVSGAPVAADVLLRVCVSEAGWLGFDDCSWIWKTASSVRRRGERVDAALSRLSPRVGVVGNAKTPRQRWVAQLTTHCDLPLGYVSPVAWDRGRCLRLAEKVLEIVRAAPQRRPSAPRPIAWGGRCEDAAGACDDRIACRRGLRRIPTSTANAFWCRPGTASCPEGVDPVCAAFHSGG